MMMFMLTKLKTVIINQNATVITRGYESYCDCLAEVAFMQFSVNYPD